MSILRPPGADDSTDLPSPEEIKVFEQQTKELVDKFIDAMPDDVHPVVAFSALANVLKKVVQTQTNLALQMSMVSSLKTLVTQISVESMMESLAKLIFKDTK